MSRLDVMMSSENMGWQTPPEVLAIVREFFGGKIALDPCSEPDNPTQALSWLTKENNGLAWDWVALAAKLPISRGVFVNPPYGRGLGAWSAKMRDEGKRGAEIIGLLPARTDTRWWQAVTTADAVCFWRGRIKFVGAPNSAPFPSALPYWGPRPQEFRRIFERYGWVVFSRQQELFPV